VREERRRRDQTMTTVLPSTQEAADGREQVIAAAVSDTKDKKVSIVKRTESTHTLLLSLLSQFSPSLLFLCLSFNGVSFQLVDAGDESCATFIFTDEDHTLGNSLRYFLAQYPAVEFAAYNVPHPLENKMTIRIQTCDGTPAILCLKRALRDMQDACLHIKTTFNADVDAFRAQQQLAASSKKQ
jgi:DNA-directed RNA polymerases I and III subunit RPAC2